MSDFYSFAQACGLLINHLTPSEKIQRCGTTSKPRSTNGAFFYDGNRGWVFDWSGEAQVQWWNDPNAKPWTDEDKAEFRRQQAKRKQAQIAKQKNVALQAQKVLEECDMMPHGYLQSKGFDKKFGLVVNDELLIPIRNISTGALQGYQRIYRDEGGYTKKMLAGMAAKNGVFWMGQPLSDVVLCEGYATGLSIQAGLASMRSNKAVCVCFSAQNMVSVAAQIRQKKYVFADNDASQTGQECAQRIGAPWVMSDQVGEDANDLSQRAGLFALVKKLQELFR